MARSPAGNQPFEWAPAKVNLYLHVTGRRPDGLHLLDSLVVFAAAADRVSARPASDVSVSVSGPFADSLAAVPENLVLKAARALAAASGITTGAALHLEKNLPVAAGIGGGSADAAAALRLLCRLWGLIPAPRHLATLAAALGADVPVCLAPAETRMQGVGERLSPGPPLPPLGLVLLNPLVAVATAEVFRHRTGGFSEPADLPPSWPSATALAADLARFRNDLEPVALALAPDIRHALAALRGAPGVLLARMSGSGATCFGLFSSPCAAADAAAALARPGWWCWGGGIFRRPR